MVSIMYVRKGGHWFQLKQVKRKRIRPENVVSMCAYSIDKSRILGNLLLHFSLKNIRVHALHAVSSHEFATLREYSNLSV